MTKRRDFGSVRKLRSGRWQVSYWHEGERHIGPHTFATKADSSTYLSTVEADIHRGAWVDPEAGKVMFRAFAESWLANRPDLRPRSVQLYRSLLDRHLLPSFGATPMARVTPSSVSRWHSALVAEKPAAAASAYRLLRAIFSSAVRDETLLRSPCRVTRGGTDRAIERPMLTVAQVEALTRATPTHLRAAVALAGWGALRRGEVLALRRRDVDPMRSMIRVERAQVELNDGSVIFGLPKTDAGVRAFAFRTRRLKWSQSIWPPMWVRTLTPCSSLGGVESRCARGPWRLPSGRLVHRWTPRRSLPRPSTLRATMAAAAGATTKELMRRAGHSSPAAASALPARH